MAMVMAMTAAPRLQVLARQLFQALLDVGADRALGGQAQALDTGEGFAGAGGVLRLDRLAPHDGAGVGARQGPAHLDVHGEREAHIGLHQVEHADVQHVVAGLAFNHLREHLALGDSRSDRALQFDVRDIRLAGCRRFAAAARHHRDRCGVLLLDGRRGRDQVGVLDRRRAAGEGGGDGQCGDQEQGTGRGQVDVHDVKQVVDSLVLFQLAVDD